MDHCAEHSGLEARIQNIQDDLTELKKDMKATRKTINVWMGGIAAVVFLLQLLPKLITSAQAAIGG